MILRERLAAALAGHGSLVLIGGAAGIGKTALAETVCREATDQGALVLVGHCYDLTDTPPYGPWVELFGRYQADGGPQPPTAFAQRGVVGDVTSQAALFQQVKEFLIALSTRRPIVFLHDDLHWADPASLDLLRVLARDIALLPVLLLATYRADEVTRLHPLYALLSIFVREAHAERLDLRPLTENDLRELIGTHYRLGPTDTFRLIAYLQERAEGNPFFLGELLRTLEEEQTLRATDGSWTLGDLTRSRVPPLLQQVIDGRLARLGEEAQTLLGVAAVIGQEIPLPLWAAVTGVNEETLLVAIERTVAAHFIEEMQDGMHFRFVHALVREALYEGLAPTRRRMIHCRVGEVLAATSSPDPDAVADHFRRAADDRAAEWLVTAGERAQRTYAWLTAATRYETAIVLLKERRGDTLDLGWLLFRLARLRRFANPQQGIAALDEVAQLAAAIGDRSLTACALAHRGLLHCFAGNARQGLAEMETGIAILDTLTKTERGQIETLEGTIGIAIDENFRGTLALWLACVGRYGEASIIGEHVVAGNAAALPAGSLDAYADAYFALAYVYAVQGKDAEAHRAFAQARDVYRAIAHHYMIAVVTLNQFLWVAFPYSADHLSEWQALAVEAVQAQRRAGGVDTLATPELARLPLLLITGNWREARPLAQAIHSASGHYKVSAKFMLGPLARDQGDTALAWTLVREDLPGGPQTEPGNTDFLPALVLQRLAAMLSLDAGDLRTSEMWLEAHDRWLIWSSAILGQAEGCLGWAAYYRAAGDDGPAYHHAIQALACASEPRQPLALLAAHRLLGELDIDAGRHADAETRLDAALALADICAAPYERALTLLALAELHVATGNRTDAGTLLDEVHAICTPLGAKPALARVDALAERLANTPNPSPAYPDDLTPREAEVLRLIAAGRSNREIAAALFISTYTVSRHVENVYRKIGVHGRADATAYAFRHRLT